MITKTLEVRDRHTIIPVVAMSLHPTNEGERWLIHKCGFGVNDGSFSVMLGQLMKGGLFTGDASAWGNRTMKNAHLYIEEHFDELKDGDVIDVQFILGETATPKISERFSDPE
jgi:hypothetical protein